MNFDYVNNKGVVNTVKGFIPPGQLGYCQCHEHLFIAKGKSSEINPSLYIDDKYKTIEELKMYENAGGNSIVDAQPIGCGRMANLLLEASIESGINIVASTGFHKLVFYDRDHWIYNESDNYLTKLFIDEINNGMYVNCDYNLPSVQIEAKAGIIKVAVDSCGIKNNYIKLFNAAANASLSTGAPILCHIEKGSDALEVINFFNKKGLNLNRIILCHLDRAIYDIYYHKEILKSGVYLEYDTIGRFKYHSDEQEINLISSMVKDGFQDKILLGLDTTRERLKSYGGLIGLDYIKKEFISKLLTTGMREDIIELFMVKNPSAALIMI
jgi:5-phospho-D-xylono-1,4-lactonase